MAKNKKQKKEFISRWTEGQRCIIKDDTHKSKSFVCSQIHPDLPSSAPPLPHVPLHFQPELALKGCFRPSSLHSIASGRYFLSLDFHLPYPASGHFLHSEETPALQIPSFLWNQLKSLNLYKGIAAVMFILPF